QGDGVTQYYYQGPTFDPDNIWDPDETLNLKNKGAVKGTDIKDLVEGSGCGVWAWSGDKTGVFAKIDEMAASDKLEEMGLKGRKYAEENFRVECSVRILERRAGTLCMGPRQELADGR
ncbi:MAG TPA: hypothetical protein PLT03_04685, partial [Bacillota bacterium]|nr:hypothetical protein [Bacillota bacterium]